MFPPYQWFMVKMFTVKLLLISINLVLNGINEYTHFMDQLFLMDNTICDYVDLTRSDLNWSDRM